MASVHTFRRRACGAWNPTFAAKQFYEAMAMHKGKGAVQSISFIASNQLIQRTVHLLAAFVVVNPSCEHHSNPQAGLAALDRKSWRKTCDSSTKRLGRCFDFVIS